MKKQKLILAILFLSMISISCSDDDDDKESPVTDFNQLIIGEWNYESQLLNGKNQPFSDISAKKNLNIKFIVT